MAKTKPPIESLGQVLDASLKRFDLSQRLDEYGVWPIWNDVVGKTIAQNAQPEKIRNGTLIIKVSSPVWMQQLQFMKEMIAEKLNDRLGTRVVKNLFFTVGKVAVGDDGSFDNAAASEPETLQARAPNQEFLQSIKDPEIRAAFTRLLKSYGRRQPKS